MSVAIEHVGPWTVAEVLALPEDGRRFELVDGVLIVNPPPSPGHQSASYRLHRLLDDAVIASRSPLEVFEGVGLALPDDELLVPDLTVVRAAAPSLGTPLIDPSDVALVVEIVSPASRTRDRSEKPYLYAEAGIPHFWRIETVNYRGRVKPLPVVLAHDLVGLGEYANTSTMGAGEFFAVSEPFPVKFDPAELLTR